MRLPALCGLLVVPMAWGQPQIHSILNSASYAERQVAPGSIFVLFGYGIGPDTLQQATGYPLPSQLAGVSVQVTSGSSVLNCPVIYVSNTQTAAILPSNTPLGPATISLQYGGRASIGASGINVVSSAFGIYSVASSGVGAGIITGADFVVKGLENAAQAGETVILWGTGLGPTDGSDSQVPVPGRQFQSVEVFAGASPAKVVYAGRSGCCAGLDQVAFVVPPVTGCVVPIIVHSGGLVSNFVTLPVSSAGPACPDTTPGIPRSALTKALNGEEVRLGAIAVGPIRVLQTAGFQFTRTVSGQLSSLLRKPVSESDADDLVSAYLDRDSAVLDRILRKYKPGKALNNPGFRRRLRQTLSMDQQGVAAAFGTSIGFTQLTPRLLPHLIPAGTCIVTPEGSMPYNLHSRGLSAGVTLNFSGPLGQHPMSYLRGTYQASLGTISSLPQGAYVISGGGSQDIPAFSASLNLGSQLVWTNKAVVSPIDRSAPLTISWTGGSPSGFVLLGASVHSDNRNTTLVCVESAARQSFTIPAFALSALPAATSKDAYFFIAPHPLSATVEIGGLDRVFFANATSDYQPVDIR